MSKVLPVASTVSRWWFSDGVMRRITSDTDRDIGKRFDTFVDSKDYDALALSLSDGAPKWIPVSDRCPTRVGDEYLIYSSTGYCTTLEYAGDGKWRGLDPRCTDDYWTKFVTHWMPLPEAPKCPS